MTAGIRTHIPLLTPELEYGKLDHSATTLQCLQFNCLLFNCIINIMYVLWSLRKETDNQLHHGLEFTEFTEITVYFQSFEVDSQSHDQTGQNAQCSIYLS